MKDTRSKELYERAKVHIPGGVNSPVRAFRAVNRTPRFMESAKGLCIFMGTWNLRTCSSSSHQKSHGLL